MNIKCEVIKISQVSAEKIDYGTVVFKTDLPLKIDIDNSKELWVFLKTLITGGVQKVLIDMRDLEYIDSSGIGIIINAAKLLRKQKGDIVLANVSEEIKNIFKVINLENFIKVYNSDVEALNSLRYV